MTHPKDQTQTILVIDDQPDNRALLEAVLGVRGGVQLRSAGNAEQGLALAKEQQPDLIIVGLALPDRQGTELLEELKSNPGTESTPVILLTAIDSEDVPRAVRDRVDAVHTLPVGPAALLELIDARLGRRR